MPRHVKASRNVKVTPDADKFLLEFVKEHDSYARSNMLMQFFFDKIKVSSGKNNLIFSASLYPILKEKPEILDDINNRCRKKVFTLCQHNKCVSISTFTLLLLTEDYTLRDEFKLSCPEATWQKIREKLQIRYDLDKEKKIRSEKKIAMDGHKNKSLSDIAPLPVKQDEQLSAVTVNSMRIDMKSFLTEFYKPHSIRVRGQMLLAFILRKLASKKVDPYKLGIAKLFPILQKHPVILQDINRRLGATLLNLNEPRHLNISCYRLLDSIETIEKEFGLTLSDDDVKHIRKKAETKSESNQLRIKIKRQSQKMNASPLVTQESKTTPISDGYQSLLQQPELTFFSRERAQDDSLIEMLALPEQALPAPSDPVPGFTPGNKEAIEPLFPDLIYLEQDVSSHKFKL